MNIDQRLNSEFLSVPLNQKTMLYYCPRTAILRAVRTASKNFFGTVLDVGCGFMPYRPLIESNLKVEKYLGLDLVQSEYSFDVRPHLTWDGRNIPLPPASVECVMATEFLEHCAEPAKVLVEIRRVMKNGGVFFATVPFIWNLHEIPYDEQRFTPYSLERVLADAGFSEINISPLGGWNYSLAQMLGLWVTFAEMTPLKCRLMRFVLFPFYSRLIRTDMLPADFDGAAGSMFSGLSVTAVRH
jgi:SAM-dependent methyltransferase